MPARIVLGVAWSPEHRCLHYAVVDGYCRQHQPREQDDDFPTDAGGSGTRIVRVRERPTR